LWDASTSQSGEGKGEVQNGRESADKQGTGQGEAQVTEGDRERSEAKELGQNGDVQERRDMSTTRERGGDENKKEMKDRLHRTESDSAGGREEREGTAGTEEQERDGEQVGRRQQTGAPKGADQFRADTATQTKGVDEFEAAGKPGERIGDGERGEMPGGEGASRSNLVLLEQLLEQAEGAPAYLLRNQFRLEEQRALRSRGSLHEPRPW
jgi:hypothetical protein